MALPVRADQAVLLVLQVQMVVQEQMVLQVLVVQVALPVQQDQMDLLG
jgi:hypothetical protein